MRFWISRRTAAPIHEQLSAQFMLGIMSRRLRPGMRLPSVRTLARKLKIHANTVSAVYHDLAARGWVEARTGSGVFVARRENGLIAFAKACAEEAKTRGYSLPELQAALRTLTLEAPGSRPVVYDPDVELARILAAEISEASGVAVAASDQAPEAGRGVLVGSGRVAQMQEALAGVPHHPVRLKSMEEIVAGRQRPAGPALIAVASRSDSILEWARVLMAALGFHPDGLVLRNAREDGWREGLAACDIVAADVITAKELSGIPGLAAFRIISPESLAEACAIVTARKVS